jgi:hypothetical protein
MKKSIIFYGKAGAEYGFEQVAEHSGWGHEAGVAVFAVKSAFGWRIIKLAELSGQDHDVRPIWAYHEAQRFGADTVFIHRQDQRDLRRDIIADLEAGLVPVVRFEGDSLLAAA